MSYCPTIPLRDLLLLWSELEEAKLGKNGYGSDTAELYAYRFVGRQPLVDNECVHGTETWRNANAEMNREAADALVWLVDTFCRLRECFAYIDGHWPNAWREKIGDRFGHRAHVRVCEGSPI